MKALGKAGYIDASMGDVQAIGEKMDGGMIFLVPFIMFGQVSKGAHYNLSQFNYLKSIILYNSTSFQWGANLQLAIIL